MKTLIVDDDPVSLRLIAECAKEIGADVSAYTSSEEGWQAAQVTRYPLIILDWIMPGLDGLEFCRRLRALPRGEESIILVVTVRAEEGDLRSVLDAGANDYLAKPIELSSLRIRLEVARQAVVAMAKRREAEAEVARLRARQLQSEKMMSMARMISGIAHELNNPLQAILGYSQLLIQDLPASHPIRKDIVDIEISAQRSRSIVKSLLQFAQCEESRPSLTDLQEFIDSFLNLWKTKWTSENIRVISDFQTPGAMTWIDARQMNQVLFNLCQNAAQAMPQGGTLAIRTHEVQQPEGAFYEIQVSDTGRGIPPKDLARVFDPFFTTQQVGDGSGLGLSICHGIIEQHQGRIAVESEGVGRGTTARILLPAGQP